MKTSYTTPKLSSIADNEITDISSIELYMPQLRFISIPGVPVRIEINPEGYVELSSEEEELNLSKYNEVFEKLFGFFFGVAYLYGVVLDGNLIVYDILTNENYLSTRDMLRLEADYGLPVVKPIAEGNFSFSQAISILGEKINGEGIPSDSIHILPSVYVSDNRTYTSIEPKITSSVIYGEKKPPKTTYVWPATASTTSPLPSATTTATKTNTVATSKHDIAMLEIFKLSTKAERSSIFKETLKNINSYREKIKNTLTKEEEAWWSKYGTLLTYLYSIHTMPSTRQVVYEYCQCYMLPLSVVQATPISLKWAYLFVDMFMEIYPNTLKAKGEFAKDSYKVFEKFFKQELELFDTFYSSEGMTTVYDWREIF